MKTIKLLTAGFLLSGIVTVKAQQTIDGVKVGFTGPAYGVTIDTQNYLQNYTGGWARGFWIGEYNKPTTIGFGSYGNSANGNLSVNYSYIGKDWVNPFMTFNHNGNIGIGTTNPQGILDINSGNTGSIPVFRGNGGYIPTGLRFVDESYTQPGEINEWSIWKGNTWAKGLAFMRYDAVNRCHGGVCDVSLFLADNGNVGIGNSVTPNEKLTISNGNLRIDNGDFQLINNGDTSKHRLVGHNDRNNYYIGHYDVVGSSGLDIHWYGGIKFGTSAGDAMVIKSNGNVGIGSQNPDEKLTVKGNIHAEEVRVDLSVPADYVFEKYYNGVSTLKADYIMPTLAEVEKYTKENNHLPNIPSAKEIQEKGLHVGEMTNLLLQKVEELTLYTIEQQKRIEALEAKLAEKK